MKETPAKARRAVHVACGVSGGSWFTLVALFQPWWVLVHPVAYISDMGRLEHGVREGVRVADRTLDVGRRTDMGRLKKRRRR